jgi:UDP-N-acetylmuramyl tripeptide synthase
MGSIATRLADFTVITSDNPRSEDPTDIINQILMGIDEGASFAVIPERKRAIEYAIATAKRGDIIVLAGKGHEKYEINANGRSPFDEREVIRETIEKYYERKK